ncbi:DUF6098 family protein [Nocardia carnea]|uniref:DUF6098 family protein n=1 Tax=Nocardia carnea TaxID=37328 RepID=UPI0024543CD4|nr:DUF6098 family protein [Nocardia carnea]
MAADDLWELEQSIGHFDELCALVADRDEVIYLRYSHGPARDAEGPSHDFEADVDLPGLSVTVVTPEPWWPRPARDWIARRLCKYAELGEERDRFPWLLTGRVAGFGPDHEPLIADPIALAPVSMGVVEEALRIYNERFHVGQDSRR